MFKNRLKIFTLLLIMCFSIIVIAGCGDKTSQKDAGEKVIVVGSKDYNEAFVLGELLAQTIERQTDITVKRELNLGGTMVIWEAIKRGEIDLYPEYTGTSLMAILKHDVMNNPDEVYDLVQKEYNEKYKIKFMKPFGFNNTYATAVTQEFAQKHNLANDSDLKDLAPDLVFGCEQEYYNRKDGYPGWIETYGLKFKDVKQMDCSLKYKAIGEGKVDVIDAFSTDGELVTYKLAILKDDKSFFPPYQGATIVRMETLEKYPELEGVLNQLAGKIDEESMQHLNYKTKEKGQKLATVVSTFLDEIGIKNK